MPQMRGLRQFLSHEGHRGMNMRQDGSLIAGKFKKIPWKLLTGIVIGGTAGFLYYYFVGCASGTCPITSNPYGSVLYGSLMGALIARI